MQFRSNTVRDVDCNVLPSGSAAYLYLPAGLVAPFTCRGTIGYASSVMRVRCQRRRLTRLKVCTGLALLVGFEVREGGVWDVGRSVST